MNLNELAKKCHAIMKKRMENGADISGDCLKHCSGELVEAVEARSVFRFSGFNADKRAYAHELADIIVCVLDQAVMDGIDIQKALEETVEKNELRASGKGDKL